MSSSSAATRVQPFPVKVDDCECGSFSQEGILRVSQPILCICRSSRFVGSCRYGNVVVGCTNIMSLPAPDSKVKCKNYQFEPYSCTTSQPPNTSNMGCFWNKRKSRRSPVFNLNGDIVGMLSSKVENYDIAVHVSALHSFTDSATKGPSTKVRNLEYTANLSDPPGIDSYPVSVTGSNGLDTYVNGPGVKHVLKSSVDDDDDDDDDKPANHALGAYDQIKDKWTPDNPKLDVGIGLRLDYGNIL
ncbi:hypothetical protein POM88_026814 [Heracleum sosnowskyi]|uniref:Uncharacterized protein n=1 Tax=Heracleum sosnowskyi TaxID=360622 RepID=A0AAD8MKZ1_9APIA|nr:hypothetical protein POM88_026814 [Heracleum sosnowskyi]